MEWPFSATVRSGGTSIISVPFLLVDTKGESITVAAVKSALKTKLAVEKTHKEALGKQSSGQMSQSLLPLTEAWVSLQGLT